MKYKKDNVPEFEWACKVCDKVEFYIVADRGVAYAECTTCFGRFKLQAFIPPTSRKVEAFVTQLDSQNIIIAQGDKLVIRSSDGNKGK
jgi:hypothetical protein